ncbi:MAG: CoA-binding protein [Thaumarchaeota archaeon]|nr:CoA-binding protein [Nitrososphaerota archaeon]
MSSSEKATQTTTVSPREVLKNHKVIAVVGASKNPEKDAHTVPLYLKQQGYKIIPINPTADRILGEKAYPNLLDLPGVLAKQIEVVNVFRPSEELPKVAREVVEIKRLYGRPLVFWAQLGLENEEAKRILNENKIPYVMNACIRTVHKLGNWDGDI